MANRLALVVDDSRTARITLKRMLEKQGLEVATLESGPAALEYLAGKVPDIIFLDHMMPEMDGFEAIQAIKGKPETAAVPVMMYTSKGGEDYISEARALGAVGILPKQVQPAELFNVLNRLGLVKDRRARSAPTDNRAVMMQPANDGPLPDEPGDMQEIARQAAMSAAHSSELRSQFGELLMQHNSVIEEDLSDIKATLARLTGGAGGERGPLGALLQRTGLFVPLVVLLVMLIPLVWLQKSNTEARMQLDIAREQAARLQAAVQQFDRGRDAPLPLAQPAVTEPPADRRAGGLYNSLAWAVNLGGEYGVDEEAFGDRRLAIVYELVSRLDALGFRGVVRLESHLGQFCLVEDGNGGYRMAEARLPVRECAGFGHPLQPLPQLGERQSIAFANFLATSPLVNDGDIRVEIVGRGYDRPHLKYPSRDSDLPAGEWNRIARANNRVNVVLVPGEG